MNSRGLPKGRPLRVGLITNPGSGRNRRGGHRLRRVLQDHPTTIHREAQGPAEVAQALADLGPQEPDLLVVNGGDGTVQSILTVLFHERPFARLPVLALLRGGTTNMTAGDVGLPGNRIGALRSVLSRSGSPLVTAKIIQRPILKVAVAGDAQPRYGMFFGAGAIIKGIEYCHAKVHSKGLRDGLAPGICTLRLLLAMASRNAHFVAPVPMSITALTAGGGSPVPPHRQDYLLVLASSLERLFLGLRPYWGPVHGSFYCSAMRVQPARPLCSLPPLFWGRPGPSATAENGYYSAKVDALRLEMDGPWTLDGEIYHATRDAGPVDVSVGGWASFLQF